MDSVVRCKVRSRRLDVETVMVRVQRLESWVPPLDRPANNYLVELDDGLRIAVDAGVEGPQALSSVDYVLLTHWHWDHVLGLVRSSFSGVVCASELTTSYLSGSLPSFEGFQAIKQALDVLPSEVAPAASLSMGYTRELLEYFRSGRAKIRNLDECEPVTRGLVKALECPGHSDDHTCYLVSDRIFIGDMINPGGGLSVLNIPSYIKSALGLMSQGEWSSALPGHGNELGRAETLSYIYNEIESKLRRMVKLYSLLDDNPRPLRDYLNKLYPDASPFILWVGARSLVGYAISLSSLGLAELNTSVTPWLIRAIR